MLLFDMSVDKCKLFFLSNVNCGVPAEQTITTTSNIYCVAYCVPDWVVVGAIYRDK